MLTMSVMTRRTTARASKVLRSSVPDCDSPKFRTMTEPSDGAGVQERERMLEDQAVPDEQRDGDRFADGPPQGQRGGGQNARVGSRHHDLADDLPGRGPEGEGSLAVQGPDAGQRGAGEGDHGGDDHDGEHEPGQDVARPVGRRP